MLPRYEYGEAVRVIRNVRNDGTYPGVATGRLLVRRGSVGYVRDVGTFLQDQLIYTVDFIDQGIQVGCREQELQLESDEWIPSRFEFRDHVSTIKSLSINGDVVAKAGEIGEIEKVLTDRENKRIDYHLRINGKTLMVPEEILQECSQEDCHE